MRTVVRHALNYGEKGEINIWLIQKVDYLRKIFLVLVNICDKDLVWESV